LSIGFIICKDTLLHAIQEVGDSLSSWEETASIMEAQIRLLSSSRKNQRLAEERFNIGLDNRQAMLSRQYAALDQEYALKAVEADHWIARVDLIEALGGGYSNDLRIVQQKITHSQDHPEGFSLLRWLTAMPAIFDKN
jgi:outer membrane protein TolC